MNIGEKIKELRQRKGYTQENMAEMLNMSITNYAYIEQGKVNPNIPKLEEIAQKLEANLFELLSLNEKNVYYIHNDKQQGGEFKNENGYIIHNSLPENYQLISQENAFLKEKIQDQQTEIQNLKEIIALLKAQKA